jgi:hypothetical protein
MEEELSAWQKYKKNLGETRPWDLLNPKTAYVTDTVQEERLTICRVCPEFLALTTQCKKCGCIMKIKTKLELASCPIGKW